MILIIIFATVFLLHKANFFQAGHGLSAHEGWYSVALEDKEIMLSNRKLSTYINALSTNGFAIEQMIEETDEDLLNANKPDDFSKKAEKLPVTFVIKARKL